MDVYNSPSEAYLDILKKVYVAGKPMNARGKPAKELLFHQFKVVNPTQGPIITGDSTRDLTIKRYHEAETALYNALTNRVTHWAAASRFWETIANPDGTINSAYKRLITDDTCPWTWENARDMRNGVATNAVKYMSQWKWAAIALLEDHDTRQAFMHFNMPMHQWSGNKDQVCTMHAQFFIRENALHMGVVMRSNDVIKGLAYDMPFFISLLYEMHKTLTTGILNTDTMERLVFNDMLAIGEYVHQAHSMHIYETDFELAHRLMKCC